VTNPLEPVASASATGPPANSAVSIPFPSPNDPNSLNTYVQELVSSRRAFDGLAAHLGYSGVNPNPTQQHANPTQQQQHTRFVINDFTNAVRITQGLVSRIIEMAKAISAFRRLTADDQMALLRGGIRELLMINSVMMYNHDIDAWLPFGRDQPYVMYLQMINQINPDLFEQHVSFIRSFAPHWSSDEALMQSMIAICLFDPNRPGVTNREGIFLQQQFYYGIMKNYLVTVYGEQEGMRIFAEIDSRMKWLRHGVNRMQPTLHVELSRDLTLLLFNFLF